MNADKHGSDKERKCFELTLLSDPCLSAFIRG
jgi:hypothetical protein